MSILMKYLNETAKMTWSLLGWNTLMKQQKWLDLYWGETP